MKGFSGIREFGLQGLGGLAGEVQGWLMFVCLRGHPGSSRIVRDKADVGHEGSPIRIP